MILTPIIDYFSFTVPMSCWLSSRTHNINEGTIFQEGRQYRRLYNYITSDHTAKSTKGNGRFKRMIHSEKFGYSYFEGEDLNVSLIQISGTGCEYLRQRGWLGQVIMDWHDRATRLDIAVDIQTDTNPEVFARSRLSKRFTTDAHRREASGETWYVGGWDSDRFARVYRYEPPHPRSNFLRIEYQMVDHVAKQCANILTQRDVVEVASELGKVFGWNHDCYLLDAPSTKLLTSARVESQGQTERWCQLQSCRMTLWQPGCYSA